MEELHFCLYGDPITKKNHQEIKYSFKTQRKYLSQSDAYLKYAEDCLWQLKTINGKMPPPPYNMKYIYYVRTLRKVDLLNLEAATDDILVSGHVLEDDNCRVIVSHDGSRVYYDKENPRVEIFITHSDEEVLPLSGNAKKKLTKNVATN